MRRYSPPHYGPPRRGYGGRGRSPPRRGYGGGGGYGRSKDQNHGSLLVRNIPLDCRQEELRGPFERFGLVRDVYLPKDYYTGEPRGFAFVQFVDPYDALEAQHRMNGQIFAGREISVVLAAESRKRPEEMRRRTKTRGPSGYGERSSYYDRSHSRSMSRSPRHHPSSRSRYRSRSHSPVPRRRDYSRSPDRRRDYSRSPDRRRDYSRSPDRRRDYSRSPDRRHVDHSRSPRGPPPERDDDHSRRSYPPGYVDADVVNENGNGYDKKSGYDFEEARGWRPSPGRASRSPSGSRSRSADLPQRQNR